jgi:predicted ATPase/class 3 adenylate cyclase
VLPGVLPYRSAEHRELYLSGLRLATGEEAAVIAPPSRAEVPRDAAPIRHQEAERRQITTLSCELVGVRPATGGRDLEDWRRAVGDFRRCVSETAGRHQAWVYQHLGDNTLVLFGYPEAHEHDAERAVRAGLELCAAVRALNPDADVPMRCRVGIATGLVIIGGHIHDLRDDEIVGEIPDLAGQLQMSTQPDTVTIDLATRRLVGDLFDCRELGAIENPGSTEPIRRWQVLVESAGASRFEALRGSALSPLVGRDEEIDLLSRRWARAKAGEGQIVLVSGEPGIGKSRIVAVLEERIDAEPCPRLRYFCSPHHQDSALFPFIDQLGHAAAFSRDDTPAARLKKLEALLARTMPPDEDAALLADLLSLPASERHPLPNLSPQRKKQRTLEALLRQLEGLARLQPVVVVFENVHWIDPTSRELIDLIVERVRSMPVLLLVTFRPEFEPPWTGQSQVTMLALSRLDRRDRTALVEQIAGGKALPAEVVDQIADRTDGVPLFVEELTKSVLESGLLREEADRWVLDRVLPPLAIPTTLHASLLARLDRLGSVRHVAQIGAAIGRQFSYALLRTASHLPEDELQAALARLVASELVFQRGTPPEAVYTFKHALVQDAAHGSLLRATRQQLHAQIAQALKTHSPGLMETQPELFAQHYAEAGLVEKSVAYWAKAGHRSIARSAMTEAVTQFQKGLDQLALLPDSPDRQRHELEFWSILGAVLLAIKGPAAPEAGVVYARARGLWEQLGSPSEFLQVPYGQSAYHLFRGEIGQAQRLDKDLLRLSRQRNDSAGRVLGHYSSGRTLMFSGRFASSRSNLEKAITLYHPISHSSFVDQGGFHPQVIAQAFLGNVLFCLGFPSHALASSSAAIADARRLLHPPSLATSLGYAATVCSLAEDDAPLNAWADQLVNLAAERDFSYWRSIGAIYSGWAKVKMGDVARGKSLLRSGWSAYRATGAELMVPYHTTLLARACEIAGQIEEAMALLDDALQIVERTGERWFVAELNRLKGELLLRLQHTEAAGELYRKALSIARGQEAKLWELRAAVSFARLRRDQGRHAEARDLLAPVYGWFTEGFATPDLKEAKALLDELNSVQEHVLGSHRKPEPADALRRARSTSIASRDPRSSR